MTRLMLVSCGLLTACTVRTDSACDEAAAKIATCFPDHATIAPTCDPDAAAEIAGSSCDDLRGLDGKADGATCLWLPWLCGGGSSGSKIEVSVEQCGGDVFGGGCPYVTSASCGLVTLHDDTGKEVSRGFSSDGGRFTFDGLEAGSYRVKVHQRSGSLSKIVVDELTDERGPASLAIDVGDGDPPWARFELVQGEAAKIDQCAELEGGLTVEDAAGHAVDREEVEWDWLVELEQDGEVLERTRPLFVYPDDNALRFRMVHTGGYTLRFVRMDIPDYARVANPDYDRLRDLYSADAAPIEADLTISNSQRNKTVSISRTIVDPLR